MDIFLLKGVINLSGMLIGAFLIYLGYRLYIKNIVERGRVETSFENFSLAIRGYGPGLILALAGAALIAFCVSRTFTSERRSGKVVRVEQTSSPNNVDPSGAASSLRVSTTEEVYEESTEAAASAVEGY